jgi:hypothetical protein
MYGTTEEEDVEEQKSQLGTDSVQTECAEDKRGGGE